MMSANHPQVVVRADTRRRTVAATPDTWAFWGAGTMIAIFLFAAAAPSPLYSRYAARWSFSPTTLTLIFSVYAFGLLAGLLVTGRLSDHLGRKPVVLSGIVVEIAAMALFIDAGSTEVLGAARAVQGIATGVVLGALSAQLVEFSASVRPGLAPVVSSVAPTFGLATGALGSSALVQFGPSPLKLVYIVILTTMVLGFAFMALVRETGARRPGALASLKPVAEIPPQSRATFARVAPSLIALWALSGFYLSLAPGLIASIEHSHNLMWGGTAIFCLCIAGSGAVVVAREMSAWRAMLLGCIALCVGVGLTAASIAASDGLFFIATTLVAGVGFGLAFLGAFRAVAAVTPADKRAGTLASLYIVSYLAFSVPIVLAGLAETHYSPHGVALIFAVAVAALSGVGIAGSATAARGTSQR
jgi:MFS family permease